MTYKETVKFLEKAFPAYHKIGPAAYKADLSKTERLMAHLGHPERSFRSVHVAGTNGKGSVCHLLASILHRSGLKVGLFTSPHLLDFRERIRINGEMVPHDFVVEFVERNRPFFKSESLSFFEMTTGMAFAYFAQQQVDIAVVEVGLGGRLDSTNVITPLLSVITNIGLDHTQFLGNTLPDIAAEKAGIIKAGVPVVIGQTQPKTQPVFDAVAQRQHAPIIYADKMYRLVATKSDDSLDMLTFDFKEGRQVLYTKLRSPLAGSYQHKNLVTALAAVEQLKKQGYVITEDDIRQGVEHVVSDTGLHGRWEVCGTNPTIICETAHNVDGIRAMLAKLNTIVFRRLHIIYGCVSDKDYSTILTLFPKDAVLYFTQPSCPRALSCTTLRDNAERLGITGLCYDEVSQAIEAARLHAGDNDLILITGSIFLVADAMQYFQQPPEQ